MASSKALLVSFEALPSSLFASLEPALNQQLPLTNLHWKSASRRNYRTIQQLQLSFIPFDAPVPTDDVLPSPSTSSPTALLERPFVHLCFVSCDDSETYRTNTRHRLRAWLDKVLAGSTSSTSSVAKSAEWLIILVTPSSQLAKGKFYQRKSTVLDKIKSDFNSSSSKSKDRIVALPVHPPTDDPSASTSITTDPAVWADLCARLKDALVTSFDANVQSTEDDLRRLDAQRTVPGWNYCVFFERKEALAFAFESIGLTEDAIMVYDELEAGFEQSLKEHNIVFSALGGQSLGDDALSLFSTSQKSYKELIQTNQITIFDFKCYLFARQAHLLRQMGRLTEILTRGQAFVRGLSWALRQEQGESDLVCSWVFNTCMELADLAAKGQQAATRAEFLNLARRSLERLAITRQFLPDEYPFNNSQSELLPRPQRGHVEIRQTALVEAFSNQEQFAKLYADVLKQSKEAYQSAKRGRLAVTIGHVLAAFYKLHNDRKEAAKLFASSTYGPSRWRLLEGYNLHQSLTCRRPEEGGREELLSALAALRAGTREPEKGWTVSPIVASDQGEYALSLLDRVRRRANELEKDLAAIGFPPFAFTKFVDEPDRDETGAVVIPYQVTNHLPCAVNVDELRLKLTTPQGEQFWFLSAATTLHEGVNDLRAKSLADVKGSVVLDTFQIRLSHILFQYSLRDVLERKTSWSPEALAGSSCRILTIPQDPLAFSVSFEQAQHLRLGKRRQVVLVLQTGRHDVQEAEVTVQDPAQRAEFDWLEVTSDIEVQHMPHGVRLMNLQPGQRVELELTYSGTLVHPQAEMRIVLQWQNASSPELSRSLQTYRPLPPGLPLSVSVNNYFRAKKIISQFIVEATKPHTLTICDAELSSKDANFDIISARKKDARPLTVTAGQDRASFLFIVQPKDVKAEPSISSKQVFTLTYRSASQEREAVLHEAIAGALEDAQLVDFIPLAQKFASIWSHCMGYNSRSHTETPEFLQEALDRCLSLATLKRLFGQHNDCDALQKALKDASTRYDPMCLDELPWKSITIETDTPSVQILATGSLNLNTDHRIELGQPTTTTLRLATSYCWATEGREHLQKHGQRMSFALQADPADWAITGQFAGEFHAKGNTTIDVGLQLVPLRAGSLQVPKIIVKPLPPLSPPTEEFATLSYLPSCELHQSNAGHRVEVVSLSTEAAFWVPLE